MRPIELTVKGLHSFREKQMIDFQTLCAGGVFGIFGPTGSGKSSLLDAMTLALYGKVERAANNTHGIMNHAEDTLSVGFTFQLGYQGSARRYRAERSLKRTGETALRTATCRLLDVTGDPVVLADKTGDVNRKVEDLLGLSSDDFTRAVVLPQGKFAEFLSLKGSERRHMLQRLFHLEKYGDELNRKLKDRLRHTEHEKGQVEAEQAGLGDASAQAVNEAENRVKTLENALQEAVQEQEAVEKRHQEEKQLRQWQQEKEEAEQQLRELEKKKEDIAHLEKTIRLSTEAGRLLPYAEEVEESEQKLVYWQQEQQKSTIEAEAAEKKEQAARKAYDDVRQQKNEQEPQLQIRLDRLEQAKETMDKVHKEKEALQKLGIKKDHLESERQQAEEKRTKAREDRETYQQAQEELKKKLHEREIPAVKKHEIYRAYEDKQRLKHDEARLREERKELEEKQHVYNRRQNGHNKQKEACARMQEQSQERFFQIYRWYERSAEEERELECFHGTIKKEIKKIKQELEAEQTNRLAHQLAQRLQEGEPCPVCGSAKHPQPVQRKTGDGSQLEDRLHQLENWAERVHEAIGGMERSKWQLQHLANRMTEGLSGQADQAVKQVAAHIEAAGTEISSGAYGHASHTVHSSVEQEQPRVLPSLDESKWEEKAANMLHVMAEEKQAVQDLERLVQREQQQLSEAREQLRESELSIENIKTDISTRQEKVSLLKSRTENAKAEWQKAYPGYPYDSIEDEQKKVRQLDEEAAGIRHRLEKSIPHIEKKEQEIQHWTGTIGQLQVEMATITAEIKQKTESAREMESSLHSILAGQNVAVLLRQTKERLKNLQKQEQHAQQAVQQAMNALQKATGREAVAKQSLQDAQNRYNQARSKWEQHKEHTPFRDVHSVKEALLDQETEQAHTKAIETYHEQTKQLHYRIEERNKQLNGRHICNDQWQKTVELLRQAREKVDAVREERGAAAEVLKDLKIKHRRYRELNEKKEKLNDLLDQYRKLDHVFRGKAFVEFIAEEQLIQVSRTASERLHALTRGRYAIEVDSGGGFVIRDDANVSVKRPVSTLSGGETFLTSLALSLSLSTAIQLKGQHPLEFFFLDEGFGTLDQELLETVVTALEKLHTDHLSVGVISHVPELQERLPRKLMVMPAQPGGKGSTVRIESM